MGFLSDFSLNSFNDTKEKSHIKKKGKKRVLQESIMLRSDAITLQRYVLSMKYTYFKKEDLNLK